MSLRITTKKKTTRRCEGSKDVTAIIPAVLRFITYAAVVALLAGCNLAGEPAVTYVVVTSTPGGPTEMPTLPPTPTTPPDVLVRLAERDAINGYYENAIATYRLVQEQGESAPPDMRASAAFGLGRAALREGFFGDAVSALTTVISQFPQDPRAAPAYFLRGDAYMGLSEWAQAIADFQQYLVLRPGLIDSYVNERIADAQLALGQLETALNSYNLATSASRSLVPLLALREKVARVYRSAELTEQAVAQYDAILAAAKNAPYRASMELEAGQALIEGDDLEKGLARMQLVFDTYSDTPAAYSAMQVLLANGRKLDDFAIGKVSFGYGDYLGAIDAFNRFTSHTTLDAIPAELYMMLGRAYREVGNPQAAVTAFETIVTHYPQDALFGQALLEQGRTKFLSGDIPGAIAEYLALADTYGYLNEAPEALWRAGYLYGTNGDPANSRAIFERLAGAYPDTEQARSGLFIAASAAVNAGDIAGAERLFGILATTTSGDDRAAAYLWVGKLALQRGDANAANMSFRMAAEAVPEGYYSVRAEDILGGRRPFQNPTSLNFDFDDVGQLTAAENWLRQTFGATQEGYLWPLSPALEADPRLIRGRELWTVGAYAEADIEFTDVLDDLRATKDALASYQMAIFLRGIAAYRPSVVAAADVIRAAGVTTLAAPAYLARMRYPTYYRDVVLDIASRRNLDPLLLFALIRHESLFDTNATGAAGEKGLTQVIPSTGEYIAGKLEWPDYQHSDLFRPYAGIEFGAYYLDEQLQRFNNNVPVALAGYNAGPGNASNWLELSGDDPDLFVATITIDGTRLYVQRIYTYYDIYRTLYGVG